MEQLDRQDAIDWYNEYYTPNNAILIVAGDISEDEVRDLAQKDLWQGRAACRAGGTDSPARTASAHGTQPHLH